MALKTSGVCISAYPIAWPCAMKYSMSRRMPDTQIRPPAVMAEGSQLRPLRHCRMVATTAIPAPTGQITLHSQLTAFRNAPSGCDAV